ncbi:MAG: helix-turn-helix transcriptional regulator [Pseudomonadota bacterium]
MKDGFDHLKEWFFREDDVNESRYTIASVKGFIGDGIYKLRRQYGLSMEGLSEMTGFEEDYLDRLEEGDYDGEPDLDAFENIEKILRERLSDKECDPKGRQVLP